MRVQRVLLIAAAIAFIPCHIGFAQGTKADYERSKNVRALMDGKVSKTSVQPNWFDENKQFWYKNNLGQGKSEFIVLNAEAGTRKAAFDHAKVAEAMAKASGKEVTADKLPIKKLSFAKDGVITLSGEGGKWMYNPESGELKSMGEGNGMPALERLPRPKASENSTEDTTIVFQNDLDQEVELYWIDTYSEEQAYGTLAAGEKKEQHTYIGHVWIAKMKDQRFPLAVFQAVADPHLAVINRPESGNRRRRGGGGMPPFGGPRGPRGVSPDKKWEAFIKDHNLYVRDVASKEEFALSKDGVEGDDYGGEFNWSPDSQKLVVLKTKDGQEHIVYMVQSSPPKQVQPILKKNENYLKPGDEIPLWRPCLFNVSEKKQIPVSTELCTNPWYETIDIRWEPDSKRFIFVYNQRGHHILRLLSADAETGVVKTLIEDESPMFIDYSNKFFQYPVEAMKEIIWMSERDGWNHLYLFDAETGKLINQITHGEWVLRRVENVDMEKRQIWFTAGGIVPGQDPYYIHYARINFDGTGLTLLTEGNGTHSINYSPDKKYYIDTYSRVDMPAVNELRRTEDGKLICVLEKGDMSELVRTGWTPAEPFVAKGRDGKTDIYGIIIRPLNFDPNKKYPVLENIYAGPQDAFVPKGFSAGQDQDLAELGFIVVHIDGMGTNWRSKAFHNVCYKNLVDAGFPDRILWMKAAAAKYPYMDLTKVGLFGGSAGGQNAAAGVIFHGDFYKAASADCGCHDNRMDKIWWNEAWMGYPVDKSYEKCSNVVNAKNMPSDCHLLLLVGEQDTNVDPASTMQVCNALIKADKDFELVVFPNANHGAGSAPYGQRRMQDFFVRHLMGVEPRSK